MIGEIQNDSTAAARVAIKSLSKADYASEGEILEAIVSNSQKLGWDDGSRGAFGRVIPPNSRVVVKPNFVLHANQGTGGMLPLITHESLIKAVTAEVLKADPSQVLVGDSPIQSCDFEHLLNITGLGEWARELQYREPRFQGIKDFRRTTCVIDNGLRVATENVSSEENYVLYNLKEDSLLEPLTGTKNSFRVTSYDPRIMAKAHSPSNHQYLIAREIIDADVVLNLPKLKTHKKAGITCALKNLVGINGNKEYLPHHRLGGSADGGDCYPGSDALKRTLESVLDLKNMAGVSTKGRLLTVAAEQLGRAVRLKGDKLGVEGSWSGNETVARMTLDLNRILLYGKADASISDSVQRRVLHVVDAVIAGQGDGPLASDELPLGMILASESAAAVDWVGAHLLGYDATQIPLLKLAFEHFRWPITEFDPEDIMLLGESLAADVADLLPLAKQQNVVHPIGWRSAAA